VIDEALGVAAPGAGSGEIGFSKPKIGDLIVVSEMKVTVNMFEETRSRERVGLINLVTNFCKVGTAAHQFAGHMVGPRTGAGVLEGTGIRRDGGKKAIGNPLSDRPAGGAQQSKDEFASRGLTRRHPVDIGIPRVAFVVVNINDEFASGDPPAYSAKAIKTRGIGCDDTVKFQTSFRFLKNVVRIEEFVFLRHGVLVPANHLFAFLAQRQCQPQLGADAVAIRSDVAGDAKRAAVPDGFQDAVDDFWVVFHPRITNGLRQCLRRISPSPQ
jgi:hypothetical protein